MEEYFYEELPVSVVDYTEVGTIILQRLREGWDLNVYVRGRYPWRAKQDARTNN